MILRPGLWSFYSDALGSRFYSTIQHKTEVMNGWSETSSAMKQEYWDTPGNDGYHVDMLVIPLELI